MAGDEWMLIGRVAAPFGVRGEMKVELLTDFPDRFKTLRRVYVGNGRQSRDVERSRMHHSQVLLKLADVDTPEEAGSLRGAELFVPRAEAAPLPEGHFYLDDVIGMTVVTTAGAEIGQITDVIRTGSNDVFVVGGGRNEVLVPVIKDAVQELDLAKRQVTIEPWVLGGEE